MKICIFGAGAGGGHFAVRLALAGHDVSIVARGPQLAAIRREGLRLRVGADMLSAEVTASDDPRTLGLQDLLIVSVKATALPGIADSLSPLLSRDTRVVFPQNGMPWWYPCELPGRYPSPPDVPVFALAAQFLSVMRSRQVIGGVIYSANEIEAPGIIKNNSPGHNRIDIGNIDSRDDAGVSEIRRVLDGADLLSPEVENIRSAIWSKLLANMSGSTIALVTRKKSAACRDDPALCEIFRRLVSESAAIAAAHGFPLKFDPDAMLSRLADHKPSLLQDYEQGRPMEVAEILLAPLAFARAKSVAVPTLDAFSALAANMADGHHAI